MFLASWLLLMVDGWDDSFQKQQFTVYSMPFKSQSITTYLPTCLYTSLSRSSLRSNTKALRKTSPARQQISYLKSRGTFCH